MANIYVHVVPLGIYFSICAETSEPSGPSGQKIGIQPPALKPGFDPLINMVRYERAIMQVDYTVKSPRIVLGTTPTRSDATRGTESYSVG